MSFKRGFLKESKQSISDQKSTSSNRATNSSLKDLDPSLGTSSLQCTTRVDQTKKISDMYQVPTSYSSIPQVGQDAPIQLFRGVCENPRLESPLTEKRLIISGGPHVLLNLDLGPNAGHPYKIPMWIYPESLPLLNDIIGRGAQWGKIKPLPDLRGEDGSGKGFRWEVKETEDKGMGLFSLQKLSVGDVVVRERPLLILPNVIPQLPRLDRPGFYQALYDRQSDEQQKAYLELPNIKAGDQRFCNLDGIAQTTQMLISLIDEIEEYVAIFPVISRTNHSCGPNTAWFFNTDTFSQDLHVVRDVQPGEELTANYGPVLGLKHERERVLMENYDFVCHCYICDQDVTRSVESERRRKDLINWESNHPTFEEWMIDSSYGDLEFVENQKRRIAIYNVEGLQQLTGCVLIDLLRAYIILGDAENVKKLGKRTIAMGKATLGDYGRGLILLKKMVENPRTNPNWNMKAFRGFPNTELDMLQVLEWVSRFADIKIEGADNEEEGADLGAETGNDS